MPEPRARWALLLLLVVAGPEAQAAAPRDFAPENAYWNGCSDLVDELRRGGSPVEVLRRVDWRRLEGDALVLLDPQAAPDPAGFDSFLRRGGRTLVGLERGPAAASLATYGIRLAARPPRATLAHLGRRELPFALPSGGPHPLTQGEPLVAANHPRSFGPDAAALLVHAGPEAEALLVERKVGEGLLWALADPSVLINNMLEFPGNRLLAQNLAGALCPRREAGAPCRILVVAGDFEQTADWRDDLALRAQELRAALSRWDRFRLRGRGLTAALAGLLLLCLALLGTLAAPAGRSPKLAPLRPRPPGPSDLRSRARALSLAARGGDLRLAAALLAQRAERVLRRRLGPGSAAQQHAHYLRRHGSPPGGAAGLAGLLADLTEAPRRDQLYAPGQRPVAAADFDDLLQRWQALRAHLEPPASAGAASRQRPSRGQGR